MEIEGSQVAGGALLRYGNHMPALRLLHICLLLFGLCGHLHATETAPTPLDGPGLLLRVRAQLPPIPLRMSGFVRTRDGRTQTDRPLSVELHFGDRIPNAGFVLTDAFGDVLDQVRVSWPRGHAVFERFSAAGEAIDPPAPEDRVADTGVRWSDLSLDFLWWEGAEIVGSERIKTRPSHIVRLPAPGGGKTRQVRLWIDQKAFFVVRAEFLDGEGRVLRRFEVDSIKEIREDFWMVKDVVIRDYENGLRAGIRFEEITELSE